MNFLVQYTSWTNEKWDGPREKYRGWKVYTTGSVIERRLLVNSFSTRRGAYDFVQRSIEAKQ